MKNRINIMLHPTVHEVAKKLARRDGFTLSSWLEKIITKESNLKKKEQMEREGNFQEDLKYKEKVQKILLICEEK